MLAMSRKNDTNTSIGAISINDRRGNLETQASQTHPKRRANPRRLPVLRETHALNNNANRDQKRKPNRIQSRLRLPMPIMFLRIPIHHPINQPSRIRLPDQTPNQQRNTQHQPRLRSIEMIELRKQTRSRDGEEHRPVAEAGHVVQPRDHDSDVLEHVQRAPEVGYVELAVGEAATFEEEEVDIGVLIVDGGGFSGEKRFGEAEEGDYEGAELDVSLEIVSLGGWLMARCFGGGSSLLEL